jgi:hypothetical protein
MGAPDDSTTSSRPVLRRLIAPWEYRHLRFAAGARFAGGGFNLGVGLVLVSLGRKAETDQERRKCYGWATWFLIHAALLFAGGYLDSVADRPASLRTKS